MASPRNTVCQPLTLQQLRDRLKKGNFDCISFPYPYVKSNECHDSVVPQSYDLQKAYDTIKSFEDNSSYSHRRALKDELEVLAKTRLCKDHAKHSTDFAYHWLAEASLPRFLQYMGWKQDYAEWTCLGSREDVKRCLPLTCAKAKHTHRYIYPLLNKLAAGAESAREILKNLMKYWLCDEHQKKEHKDFLKEVVQELLDKFTKCMPSAESSTQATCAGIGNDSDRSSINWESTGGDESPSRGRGSSRSSLSPFPSTAVPRTKKGASQKHRPPMNVSSASETMPTTKSMSPISSSDNRRTVSACETPSAAGLGADNARGQKRMSNTTYGRSPIGQESAHTPPRDDDESQQGGSDSYGDGGVLGELSPSRTVPNTGTPHAGDSVKKRRMSTPRLPSVGPTDAQGKEKIIPKWDFKNAQLTRPEVNADTLKLMKSDAYVRGRGTDDGWIYIFSSPDFPDHLKIGRTTKKIRDRKHQIESKCKSYDLEIIGDEECFKMIRCHKRLEALIHKDLWNERRSFKCTCTRVKEAHDIKEKYNKCVEHSEWFAINADRAIYVVKKWKEWMRRMQPYTWEGKLDDEMLWQIAKWQEDPTRFDSSEADRRLDPYLTPLLQNIPWSKRFAVYCLDSDCAPWIKREIFEPRKNGPSRWRSAQDHWKDNVIVVIAHSSILSFISICLFFRFWVPALMLGMAFPLLPIWYAS